MSSRITALYAAGVEHFISSLCHYYSKMATLISAYGFSAAAASFYATIILMQWPSHPLNLTLLI